MAKEKTMKEVIAHLSSLSIEDFLKEEELGKNNYLVQNKHFIERSLALIKLANEIDITNKIPDGLENIFQNTFGELVKDLSIINNIQNNATFGREKALNHVNSIKNHYSEFIRGALFSYFNFLLINDINNKDILTNKFTQFEKEVTDLKETANNSINEITSLNNKAKEILVNIEEAAGKTAVSVHSRTFDDSSKKHQQSANRWFVATIVISAVSLLIGILLFSFNFNPLVTNNYIDWFRDVDYSQNWGKAINYAISKLFILSILSFIVYWCARNYKAHSHNVIVNNHRANSLKTFQAFTDSADDNVKNAVLMYATECIFSHQISGYINKEPEPDSPNKMMQVFTDLSKLKPSS